MKKFVKDAFKRCLYCNKKLKGGRQKYCCYEHRAKHRWEILPKHYKDIKSMRNNLRAKEKRVTIRIIKYDLIIKDYYKKIERLEKMKERLLKYIEEEK